MKISGNKIKGFAIGIDIRRQLNSVSTVQSLDEDKVIYTRWILITVFLGKWKISFKKYLEKFVTTLSYKIDDGHLFPFPH
jgi:hypothetical protein